MRAISIVIVAVALCIAAYALIGTAMSHSFYSIICCSDKDCHPVADAAVEFTANGWLVHQTGEVIPFSQAKPSPDGRFHVCIPNKSVRCLYAPGFGS